jgi:hypothetical protein
VVNLNYSVPLAEALLSADPKYGTVANVQEASGRLSRNQHLPDHGQTLDFIQQVFGEKNSLPCTLLVVDEIQQFIGEKIPRAMDLQEIAEHCSTKLNQRLLLRRNGSVGVERQRPALQRLQARFAVRVQLSDADVESVIRKTVLRKKPEQESAISQCLEANQGELARHLQNSTLRLRVTKTRSSLWPITRCCPHAGGSGRRCCATPTIPAPRLSCGRNCRSFSKQRDRPRTQPWATVVPADFIYDQISTDLLNSGELEREYDEIIRKQRDGTKDGELRSSLCALIFLIGKLPRTPGADDGVRANGRNAGGPACQRSEERSTEAGSTSAQAAEAARRLRASSWRWKPNTASRRARARHLDP